MYMEKKIWQVLTEWYWAVNHNANKILRGELCLIS